MINEGRKVYDGKLVDIDPHEKGLDHIFADLTGHDPVTGTLLKKEVPDPPENSKTSSDSNSPEDSDAGTEPGSSSDNADPAADSDAG